MANRQVLFARRPNAAVAGGAVTPDCFRFEQSALPVLQPGDVLVRNIYLSCDPYMRGRMGESRSYAEPFKLNEVMPARVVGQVEQSRHRGFTSGDYVWGFLGWEDYSVAANGQGLNKLADTVRPISHAISVMGMPGLTAYVGMIDIGQPRPGDTVFVSAAAGAVGQIAGQLARIAGARVVGSVGSEHKRQHLIEQLRFDAAFNYREQAYGDALDELCPDGIDVYFDNVGGAALEAVMPRLNTAARVPVCGMISQANGAGGAGIGNMAQIVAKRAVMTGFIVYDHMHKLAAFQPRMHGLLETGAIRYFEDIVTGLENTPNAFIDMLAGKNLGKRLVRISAE